MSLGNWRSNIEIRVGLATFLTGLALFSLPNNQLQQADKPKGGDSGAQQHSEYTLGGVKKAPVAVVARQQAPPSDPKTERNEWRQEQDLQAQWDQAKWAQYAAIAAFLGVLATAIGIWFIRQTLEATRASVGATARAAEAAIQAAEASKRSADVAEQALRALERPYLFVKIVDTANLRNPDKDLVPRLRYTLVNHGRVPAILRSISIILEFEPGFPLRTPMAVAEKLYEVIAPSGELDTARSVEVTDAKPGQKFSSGTASSLFLHGLIQYEDPTGAHYTEPIRLQGNPGAKSFRIIGERHSRIDAPDRD